MAIMHPSRMAITVMITISQMIMKANDRDAFIADWMT
jgi:hypothetical protein